MDRISFFTTFFILYSVVPYAQNFQYFSILPDVGGLRNQSQLKGLAADSQYIYVMGDMVSGQDSITNRKEINWFAWVFDYTGRLISKNILSDSSGRRIGVYGDVISLYPKVPGKYDFIFFKVPSSGDDYKYDRIGRINMQTGVIERQGKIPLPRSNATDLVNVIFNEISYHQDTLLCNLEYRNRDVREKYIFEMDTAFQIINSVELKDILKDTIESHFWIGKDNNGDYIVIANSIYYKKNIPTGVGLVFKKYDTSGTLVKKVKLNTEAKLININGAYYYNVKRDTLGRFMILAKESDSKLEKITSPVVLYVHNEFDTLYKLLYLNELSVKGNEDYNYWSYYLEQLGEKKGYVGSASLDVASGLEYTAFGMLYKISSEGDSIWKRKYQPIGWESNRVIWLKFTQVKETPYKSLIVSAIVSDRSDFHVKGWLLHLDKDGCLVPGCGNVNTHNYQQLDQLKDAFVLYPNPTTGSHINLLSKVALANSTISITDIFGKEILKRNFSFDKDVQYIIDLPLEIANGTYQFLIKAQGSMTSILFNVLR